MDGFKELQHIIIIKDNQYIDGADVYCIWPCAGREPAPWDEELRIQAAGGGSASCPNAGGDHGRDGQVKKQDKSKGWSKGTIACFFNPTPLLKKLNLGMMNLQQILDHPR